MPTVSCILWCIAMLIALPARADAGKGARGASPEHVFSDERLLPTYPLVAKVVIREITDPEAKTNGNPPRLKVEILDLVSGQTKDKVVAAMWRPFPHDIDYGVVEKNPRFLEWKQKPNPPPPVKSTWILAGRMEGDVFHIAPRCRYPFSDEKLAWVKKTVIEGKQQIKEAEEKAARERAAAIAADETIAGKADLTKLWDAAGDVVIGKRATEFLGPNYYRVSFALSERLKDARAKKVDKQLYVEVAVTAPAKDMVTNRLHLYRDQPPTYMLFLRAVPAKSFQSYLENVDPRVFEFVDGDNGMLLATPDRLRRTRELANTQTEKK